MGITVRLLFNLRGHAPGGRGQFHQELAPGTTLAALLAGWGIPPEPPQVLLLNGLQASPEQVPQEGDTLVVFPPLEGG
jgi:hypothetical protein